MRSYSETHEVEPDRLAFGEWSHTRNRLIGEGDIRASYSADLIGNGESLRKPFHHHGAAWVCVGSSNIAAKAYRIVDPSKFDGETFTYAERVRDGYAGRRDQHGFYHGMRAKRVGRELVLCGPEVQFVAGEAAQGSLF